MQIVTHSLLDFLSSSFPNFHLPLSFLLILCRSLPLPRPGSKVARFLPEASYGLRAFRIGNLIKRRSDNVYRQPYRHSASYQPLRWADVGGSGSLNILFLSSLPLRILFSRFLRLHMYRFALSYTFSRQTNCVLRHKPGNQAGWGGHQPAQNHGHAGQGTIPHRRLHLSLLRHLFHQSDHLTSTCWPILPKTAQQCRTLGRWALSLEHVAVQLFRKFAKSAKLSLQVKAVGIQFKLLQYIQSNKLPSNGQEFSSLELNLQLVSWITYAELLISQIRSNELIVKVKKMFNHFSMLIS